MITYLLDMLYPRCCPVCFDIVIPKGEKICPLCRSKLVYVQEPACKQCGKPIQSMDLEYCFECRKGLHKFSKGFSLFVYNSYMNQSIAEFKFHGKREFADFYIEELVKHFGSKIKCIGPDILIPVPIHKIRMRKRGFNQAELLADGIGKALGIAVYSNYLIRLKNTLPQKELDYKARKKNLENAFEFSRQGKKNNRDIKDKKIILVDDIYTTGNTIDACAKVLFEHGASKIYFISVCTGTGQ